jgi:spore germination cell wall hydrolase CwlJ-like protein
MIVTDKEFKISLIVVVISFTVMVIFAAVHDYKKQKADEEPKMTVQEEIAQNTLNAKVAQMKPLVHIDVKYQQVVSANEIEVELAYDELEYLAACIEAEAGTQGLMGKRLVCDVILNRVDSDKFPNSIIGVINSPGQFSVVHNGAINTVSITKETFDAIEMELEHRTDDKILYFRNGHYGCGTAAYRVNEHYFSY